LLYILLRGVFAFVVLSPVYTRNNVEATFNFVERIIRLVVFTNWQKCGS